MSEYRDALPDDKTRARYDEAIRQAAAILVRACQDRDRLYMEQGSLAVGQAAWYPGHPLGSPEAIAARYEERVAEARAAQGQAA